MRCALSRFCLMSSRFCLLMRSAEVSGCFFLALAVLGRERVVEGATSRFEEQGERALEY